MKEYFSHDYHSRHDPKLMKLQRVMGMQGIGIFWCLVEYCYEQGGKILKSECESIAFDLRTECERITSVLESYELFDFDGTQYTSKTISDRLYLRTDKKEKARKSAEIRWNNAFAMRSQCDGNAKKESKGKEIKEKEIKEKNKETQPDKPVDSRFKPFLDSYCKYWTESGRMAKPPVGAYGGKALKELLKRQPGIDEESFVLGMRMCEKDAFHSKKFCLGYYCSSYETIINMEILNGKNTSSNPGRFVGEFEKNTEHKYDNIKRSVFVNE